MSNNSHRIPVNDLISFVTDAFASVGVPATDAKTVSQLMVEADIFGYSTHGIFRLRQYTARLKGGGCNKNPAIKLVSDTAATAIVDGDNGLGHLAMRHAAELAMQKAKDAGIGWVGVRRGNHAGPLALYVRPIAESGMIGMAAAVGSANHVPPFGGTDLLLGTNPVAISAPSGSTDPFVLDMATTVAAMGKIKTLAQQGQTMPEGWMIGHDGKPLTDPSKRGEGFMLPIGGAKGFGLSVGIGLMAGVLNGAAFGSNVVDFTSDTSSETNTGQFVMALNIAAFGPQELFNESASRAFEEMRASEPLPDHDAVRMPGEGKGAFAEERRRGGLDLGPALCRELQKLADELKIEHPF